MAIQRGFLERVVVSQEGGSRRPLDGIPPPDAGIHAGVGEEVAAVHLQLLDHVFGVAEHEGVVGVKFVDEVVEGGDGGQGRFAAGDAFFGTPTEQAGMVMERQDATAHLRPLRLHNRLAG